MEITIIIAYVIANTIDIVLGGKIGCGLDEFKELGECIKCTICGPGYKSDKDCGYGHGALAQCIPCNSGTFQDLSSWNTVNCEPWINCMKYFRFTMFNGTSQKNSHCGKCIGGYYFNEELYSGYDDGSHTYKACSPIGTTLAPPAPTTLQSDGIEVAMLSIAGSGLVVLIAVAVVLLLAVSGFIWYIYKRKQPSDGLSNPEMKKSDDEQEGNLFTRCAVCRTESGNNLGVNCDCAGAQQNLLVSDTTTSNNPGRIIASDTTTPGDPDGTIALHIDSNDAARILDESQPRATFTVGI